MGAIFYTYGTNDLFKFNVRGNATSLLKCDIFDGWLYRNENMTIVTDVGIDINENVQYFLTFDDFIHYFHFGKGLGRITIKGLLFNNCLATSSFPGLRELIDSLGKVRGKVVNIGFSHIAVKGLVEAINFSIISEPQTIIEFTITLGMLWHNINQAPKPIKSC